MNKKPSETKLQRKDWTSQIKRDVRYFHSQTGMEFTSIGIKAIGNSRFWERLMAGGTITLKKADELYEWMATQGFHFNDKGIIYVTSQD